MLAWFKRGALVLALFIAIWILMVLYWQTTHRMPSESEVVLYMLVLPIVFLLAIWLLRKVAVGLAAAVTARAASAAPVASNPEVPVDTSQQERGWTLVVLGSALRSAHGQAADALAEALKSKETRLPLDTELTDADGFPIKAGRIADLDVKAGADLLAAWQVSSPLAAQTWSDEQLRALALGQEVLLDLLPQLQAHPVLSAYVQANAAERARMALPTLQLLLVWPSRWSQQARQTASMWFMHLVESQGWPAERLLLSPLGDNPQLHPLGLIDQMLQQAHRQSLPCLGLVLASESWLGEDSIAALEQTGQLLNSRTPHGKIPGEGAVGLLLADAQQATVMATQEAVALHRVALGRRDKSADAGGRIESGLLSELAQHALQAANVPADQVTLLVADGDQRRLPELLNFAYAVLPALDTDSQCLKVASDCGSAGAVSSLTALALAHDEASVHGGTALCIGNQDAFDRVAVILRPVVSPIPARTDT
ncbi:MAG: hypothetical protein ABIP34_07110 [Rhodoferax sp.]|uniref:hypothetical protein n=1 Tax=Rhodoferax sp. TaxID=50421 RepID=UPI003267F9B3